MESHHASAVDLLADLDYGEGYISFRWPDAMRGEETLNITLEGFFSKSMPFFSSGECPEAVELQRDRILFRFSELMARSLRSEQQMEIVFSLSDARFLELQRVINYVFSSQGDDRDDVKFFQPH